MIRVLLAEDQAMVRGALVSLLGLEDDIEVVADVGRGDEVLAAARAAAPDVALLDIGLPGVDGLAVAERLRAALPAVRVLMLTTFNRPGYLRRAMAAGAAGFLLKDAPAAELARAIRAAHAGQRVVDPGLAAADPQPPVGDHAQARRAQPHRGDPGGRGTRLVVSDVVRASLRAQLAELRGMPAGELPPALLDIRVDRIGDGYFVRPRDWEQLRHEEGGAGRPVPYWATPWPSGRVLAEVVAADPPPAGSRVLELGCGLALPSIAAGRAGAHVLATDGQPDAVAFAAHSLALNEVEGEAAVVDWAEHGAAVAARGPWDLVLAADVLYLRANVETALRLFGRLLAPDGELVLADPGRAGTRDFLAAARATFALTTTRHGKIAIHRLRVAVPHA